MRNFLKEFETFAIRGNAIDLAVGVVIGAAFGQVTASLSNNILTPPIGLLLGGVDFAALAIPLGAGATLSYGLFLQALVNFTLTALALFLLVKLINRMSARKKKEEATPEENPQLRVLMEIRDELKK